MPQSVPARPARLRLLKRMSQATTEVAPSGGDHEVQQEVSRRHGTWVEMIVEDSDNDDEERDDPVESDHDSDCVLDALQRDLEVDVASVCPAAADALHFGRVAVQATPRQVPKSVTKEAAGGGVTYATNHPIGGRECDCQQEVSNSHIGGHATHGSTKSLGAWPSGSANGEELSGARFRE